MDWAKHRRRKAAAKCHMLLDLQTFLPRFALVKSAGSHDSVEARELCADIRSGEIAVFDKAYVDFIHLNELDVRGVFWVTRAKDNSDFLGHSENAVRWQVWTALLTYVILRFISYIGKWKESFTLLFTVIRGVLWNRFYLGSLLDRCCGTA